MNAGPHIHLFEVASNVEPIAQFASPSIFLGAEPIRKADPLMSERTREPARARASRRRRVLGRPTTLGHTSATAQGPPSGVLKRTRWQRRYAANLWVSDTLVVFGALMLAQFSGLGRSSNSTGFADPHAIACLSLIATVWLSALGRFHTRSPRVIGFGIDEYRRVVAASFWAFGAIAIATLLLRVDVASAYLAVALPVGILGLVLSRRRWRQYVAGRREAGGYQTSVLAIGNRDAVSALARELTRNSRDGYRVVAVCIPGYGPPRGEHLAVNGREIAIIGGETHASDSVRVCGADTVVIAGTEHFGAQGIRRLIWELEPMDVDLVLSPGVMDVAQTRLAMRPIAGLPLLHVEKPQYRGATRLQKRAFDFGFALVVLTLALPILLLAAVAIRLGSRGPVFYSSERIGVDGTPFSMLKLRTMVDDADTQLERLLARNECDGPLFKMRDDPRVTAVGRVLRRLSIDELPQFINVLRHEMSVVGPRPPLRREVKTYDRDVQRRLLVKPGITGLWQVNGRSDLSWDEAVRLDLWYVDNWSIVGDFLIIAKTVRAVFQRSGAY
jgi:exopolysaccharide biosynthesis polyprenyl glycosylphosphotransferase